MKTTVSLTQFLRPDGRRETVSVEVDLSAEAAAMVEHMYLSCEVLTGGEVVIYGRWLGSDPDKEVMEIGPNEAGDRSPDKNLVRVINAVMRTRMKVS